MSSLYERIGKQDAVDAAVDIFYRKVLTDPTISDFFDNVDMDVQIAKQKAFLTMAFGGPNNYTGKDLREGHKKLNIKEEHFQAVAGHLKATLEELNVPQDAIGEVMAIAGGAHDDVMNL